MILSKRLSSITFSMSKRLSSSYEEFREVLSESKNIVALTGAGISAESGIPTFRDAGGFWRTYRSTDLATPEAFNRNPSLVWEFYQYRRNVAFNAEPNNAHKALAKYEKLCKEQGRKFSIITQNVDGLHKRAGSDEVVELHGALHEVRCTKCGLVDENFDNPICEALRNRGDSAMLDKDLPIIEKKDLPKCRKCQALVRPNIVWFGENLVSEVLKKARDLIETCDLCLVIGTSSIVYPAAMFAPLVAEREKPVAEFNLNVAPASDLFQFHFPGQCGSTLPKALNIDV